MRHADRGLTSQNLRGVRSHTEYAVHCEQHWGPHFSALDSASTRACAASSGLRKRRGDAGRGASGSGSYSGSPGAANRPA